MELKCFDVGAVGFLDEDGMPMEEGIYLIRDYTGLSDDLEKIDVYSHPIKGWACFSEDFGSGGTGVDDECDCHVSVQFSGLEFVAKVGELC